MNIGHTFYKIDVLISNTITRFIAKEMYENGKFDTRLFDDDLFCLLTDGGPRITTDFEAVKRIVKRLLSEANIPREKIHIARIESIKVDF